jgi:hypothetical protein
VIVCGGGAPLPFLTPEDLARDDQWCCLSSAEDGPAFCTCWDPVYDLQQYPALAAKPKTRARRCHDCAYRPDSPERARGDQLEALPNFWCHQGIRRPEAFVHPDGRVRPVEDSADYRPPMVDGVPYKADGSPADRCAGWAQVQRFKAAHGVEAAS